MEDIIQSLENIDIEPLQGDELPDHGKYLITYYPDKYSEEFNTIEITGSREFILGFMIELSMLIENYSYYDIGQYINISLIRGKNEYPINIPVILESYEGYNVPLIPAENYKYLINFPVNENWLGTLSYNLHYYTSMKYTALLITNNKMNLVAFDTKHFVEGINLACKILGYIASNCGTLIQIHEGNIKIS